MNTFNIFEKIKIESQSKSSALYLYQLLKSLKNIQMAIEANYCPIFVIRQKINKYSAKNYQILQENGVAALYQHRL